MLTDDLVSEVAILLRGNLQKGVFDIKLAESSINKEICIDEQLVRLLAANFSVTLWGFKKTGARMKLGVSLIKEEKSPQMVSLDW